MSNMNLQVPKNRQVPRYSVMYSVKGSMCASSHHHPTACSSRHPLVVSAAYCCRCLRPIILLLDTTPCPPLPGLVDTATGKEKVPGGAALAAADEDSDADDEAAGGGKGEERRMLLAQTLVGEVVLSTKEVRGMHRPGPAYKCHPCF
jgi:hypothetical protein